MMNTYRGSCHCGAITFEVTADLADALECNCSICTKKGFLHLIVPREQFRLLQETSKLTLYRFNTGVARQLFCGACGMHPYYIPRSDPGKVDVNIRCLDGIDIATLRPRAFDGRNWELAADARKQDLGSEQTC